MMNRNKATKIVLAIFLAMFFTGGYAMAATFEGTVQGLGCVIHGKLCPIDRKDPHAAAENVFVIYAGEGQYKLVSNMSRSTLSHYLGKKVRINGNLNDKYNAIEADSFEVMKDGKFKTVWTLKAEMKERESLYRGGGGGR